MTRHSIQDASVIAISVSCADCGRDYNVKDELAGKKLKCKDCGTVVSVPMPRQSKSAGGDATAGATKANSPKPGLSAKPSPPKPISSKPNSAAKPASASKPAPTAKATPASKSRPPAKKADQEDDDDYLNAMNDDYDDYVPDDEDEQEEELHPVVKKSSGKKKSGKKKKSSESSSGTGSLFAKIGGGVISAIVVIGFVLKLLRVAGGIGGLGGGASWQEFRPPSGRYTVMFPGPAKPKPQPAPGATTYLGETRTFGCAVTEERLPAGTGLMLAQLPPKALSDQLNKVLFPGQQPIVDQPRCPVCRLSKRPSIKWECV